MADASSNPRLSAKIRGCVSLFHILAPIELIPEDLPAGSDLSD
jgi:hypothetical protein